MKPRKKYLSPSDMEDVLVAFHGMQHENPTMSKKRAYGLVAASFGVCAGTVKRLVLNKMPFSPKKMGRPRLRSVPATPERPRPRPQRKSRRTVTAAEKRAIRRAQDHVTPKTAARMHNSQPSTQPTTADSR
jgi:hypothetical protein